MPDIMRTVLLLSLCGTALAVLLAVLRRLLKNRLPKALFYYLWLLVLLRLAEGLIGPLPPLAAGVLELTNGILRLTPDRRGFVTAAALLGWGGLSVHCQTAAVTAGSGISLRLYVPAKAVQTALSAGLAALLAPYLLP